MAFCNVWTGLISLSLILVAGLFFCLRQDPQDATSHEKRWTPNGSHLRPLKEGEGHPFLQNYWYRYVYDTAKTQNKTDWYACSIMPVHSQGPTIYVKRMNLTETSCAISMGLLGHTDKKFFLMPNQSLISNLSGIFAKTNRTTMNITLRSDQRLNYSCDPENCTCDRKRWQPFNITWKSEPFKDSP
ncbi:hypothetical protein XENORESO_015670 [Xenotaenia resolanae]|uniref:Uncharacterized protein n=1 Tax=Xenotaenia resolanae TaxID=208358 RepID=A0ABV0W4M2_9TELE